MVCLEWFEYGLAVFSWMVFGIDINLFCLWCSNILYVMAFLLAVYFCPTLKDYVVFVFCVIIPIDIEQKYTLVNIGAVLGL